MTLHEKGLRLQELREKTANGTITEEEIKEHIHLAAEYFSEAGSRLRKKTDSEPSSDHMPENNP